MPARPLKILLLSSAVALGISSQAQAASTATVVKVVDGNTVKVREKAKTRTVDLLGVEVPACHAAAARSELAKLLPAKTRVKLAKDGAKKGRYVHRGSLFVNAALLRSGAAQGKALQTLKRAGALSAAENEARTAKRGLWTTCASAPTPPPTTTTPTPAADIERARKDLAGRVFTRYTTTTFGSSESRLNLCSDGRWVEDVETYSDFGPPTHYRYEGSWEVVSAQYTADVTSGRVRQVNADGSEGFIDFVAQGGKVFTNGREVSVQASGVCT